MNAAVYAVSSAGTRVERAHADEGFTLVEVLVALTGASLLGGALMAVLSSQSRFHLHNDDVVQAEQSVRALIDGMGAELRVASPGDLVLATPDSVTIRYDVLRAVVCDTLSGGIADVFVYDSVAAPNVPANWRGTAYSEPYAAPFAYSDGFSPISSISGVAEASCRATGADRGQVAPPASFRRTSGWSAAFGATPPRGSVARIYGRLTYSIGPSGSQVGGRAVRRNGQEFATPLEAGARFEFGMIDGTTQNRVAPASLTLVREIRLIATTAGRNGLGAGRQLVYEMPFRN